MPKSKKSILYIIVVLFFLLTFFTWGEAGVKEPDVVNPMVCVYAGAEIERCENQEAVCYRNDRYGLGGLSCWKK